MHHPFLSVKTVTRVAGVSVFFRGGDLAAQLLEGVTFTMIMGWVGVGSGCGGGALYHERLQISVHAQVVCVRTGHLRVLHFAPQRGF